MNSDAFHFFWKTNSPYSQWHPCEFEDKENKYNSTEQYMMYQKAKLFDDAEIAGEILKSKQPRDIKALGRKVKNFDQQVWELNSEKIVVCGNMLKFSQNKKLFKYIMKSKNKILVEASPTDRIWGIGLTAEDPKALDPNKWLGLNLLGNCLMEVRRNLTELSEVDKPDQ